MCSRPAPCHKFHSWIGVSLNTGSRGSIQDNWDHRVSMKKNRMFSCSTFLENLSIQAPF